MSKRSLLDSFESGEWRVESGVAGGGFLSVLFLDFVLFKFLSFILWANVTMTEFSFLLKA